MIEINLARQLHGTSAKNRFSNQGFALLGIVFSLVVITASWWWIEIKQQELEYLLQEKNIRVQSLAEIQATLNQLQRYQEEKVLLSGSLQVIYAQELSKKQPMVVLDGVSRSVDGLDIWLDRVQIVDQVVELRGQSFSLQEIGKYIDVLESQQVLTSLPVIEILDQQGRDREKLFSFMIRFALGQQVTT